MRTRQIITEVFSTFMEFSGDRFQRWAIDRRLHQNMLRQLEQASPLASESDWALHWHRSWTQSNRLAAGHLAAYLQETCYWVAQKTASRVQYSLPDCFQLAIATLPIVLKGYCSEYGASLKTYASLVFSNMIRDTLRQQREADSRTDWGLLRKLSQKRLIESLQQMGFSPDTIAYYRLAWNCFKLSWAASDTPATRQLTRPNAAAWAAIAHLYEQQRLRQLPSAPTATSETLERWLLTCAKAARAFLYPTMTSLNLNKAESGSGELLDDLLAQDASPLAALISQEEIEERQLQQAQIRAVLTAAIAALDPTSQTLLKLYYNQELTQRQIAAQLDIKQYTVSRRLSSVKETLLLKLAHWSQETLHTSLTSTAVKTMSVVLEEWLQANAPSSKDVP
ncbi:sigma-70 family RNA polymerase sigma factor [Phormidium sp. FACHB-592]|nr:sigma-70 family RNA polymerase sigma factor [Phormidium sp. FACHB-592]